MKYLFIHLLSFLFYQPLFAQTSNPSDEKNEATQNEQPDSKNSDQSTKWIEIDKPAEYVGGEEALIQYLSEQIKYPKEARSKGISGTVYIEFVVDSTGAITATKVLKGIGHGCDKEAIRVIKQMPAWIPAEHQGKKVRVVYTLPISFGN